MTDKRELSRGDLTLSDESIDGIYYRVRYNGKAIWEYAKDLKIMHAIDAAQREKIAALEEENERYHHNMPVKIERLEIAYMRITRLEMGINGVLDGWKREFGRCPNTCKCSVCRVRRVLKEDWVAEYDGELGRLRTENERLRKAVALLNSMVLSGEQHSATSKTVVRAALDADKEE